MTIAISKTLKHETPQISQHQQLSEDEIQAIIIKSCEKIGLDTNAIKVDNGVMQIQKSNDLKLHTLLLTLENHGLNMNLTKQTLIEVA
jgi:hypothetical protein